MMSVPRETSGTISRRSCDFFEILLLRVDPVHLFQDAARSRLHGEMDEFAEGREIADRLHQLEGDVDRVGGHEADAFHAGDFVEPIEKVVEKAVPFGLVFAVAVDVLAEQGDLFIALFDEHAALFDDALGRAGDLLAACIGDDAVGAEFIAAADDRDVGFDWIVSLGDSDSRGFLRIGHRS